MLQVKAKYTPHQLIFITYVIRISLPIIFKSQNHFQVITKNKFKLSF